MWREQINGTLGIGFQIGEFGLRLRQLSFGLLQGRLEGARIDPE